MRLSCDLDAGALYVTLTTEPVARTVDVGDSILVDVDASEVPVGIEVTDLTRPIAIDRILACFPDLDDDHLRMTLASAWPPPRSASHLRRHQAQTEAS